MTMFGQIRPIVVDENNVILAGNGLYDTLVAMGKNEADIYKYESLTENQKKKLMIADNKIFGLGIENFDTFNSFLEELQGDLDIPGFDEDILRQMVSEAEDVTEKISEYGVLDEDEIQSIRENSARREQQTRSQDAAEKMGQDFSGMSAENFIQEKQDTEITEIKKFVFCPKCGEKIWL